MSNKILHGKRLYHPKRGIKIDEGYTWNEHVNDVDIKLNRTKAMLCTVIEFVNTRILKAIYQSLGACHLNFVVNSDFSSFFNYCFSSFFNYLLPRLEKGKKHLVLRNYFQIIFSIPKIGGKTRTDRTIPSCNDI